MREIFSSESTSLALSDLALPLQIEIYSGGELMTPRYPVIQVPGAITPSDIYAIYILLMTFIYLK
jgi:hypothetical protein